MRSVQKVLVGNRVTIPNEAMDEINLKVGDFVIVESVGPGIMIIPADVQPRQVEKPEK